MQGPPKRTCQLAYAPRPGGSTRGTATCLRWDASVTSTSIAPPSSAASPARVSGAARGVGAARRRPRAAVMQRRAGASRALSAWPFYDTRCDGARAAVIYMRMPRMGRIGRRRRAHAHTSPREARAHRLATRCPAQPKAGLPHAARLASSAWKSPRAGLKNAGLGWPSVAAPLRALMWGRGTTAPRRMRRRPLPEAPGPVAGPGAHNCWSACHGGLPRSRLPPGRPRPRESPRARLQDLADCSQRTPSAPLLGPTCDTARRTRADGGTRHAACRFGLGGA